MNLKYLAKIDLLAANNPERATSMYSYHGIFTNRYISRTILARKYIDQSGKPSKNVQTSKYYF